jgi:hypothetical protein
MAVQSEQLQIRVSLRLREALKRRAREAGLDLSACVLSRALPAPAARFAELLDELRREERSSYVLAALNDFLAGLAAADLAAAVADADLGGLSPFLRNYVAAMVEQACDRKGLAPPEWVRQVEPLELPHFAVPFRSLRPHLLRSAPVPFKRRNVFVDSAIGDRV